MKVDTAYVHPSSRVIQERRPVRGGCGGEAPDSTALLYVQCERVVATSAAAEKLPARAELDSVRAAAEELARRGVSLRDAQRAVHHVVGSRLRGSADAQSRPTDIVEGAVFMMRVLEVLGNVVSSVFMDHSRVDSDGTGRRVAQLVELLVTDDPEARVLAERSGIEIAAEYDVVVVQFVETGAEDERPVPTKVDPSVVADAVSTGTPGRSLVSLSGYGGTMLVPNGDAGTVDESVSGLRAALGVDIVAATARAVQGQIADAVTHCRELIDLARSLSMESRLYRTADLALEYQLSRPGPGRSRLRSLLSPLDTFPELMHTLRTFITSEANRRASAKSLFVHPNTVDYRLKRIEQLTGVDPLSSSGLMSLHAAIVVDALARAADGPRESATSVARAS